MSRTKQLSITLSPAALRYIDYIQSQIPTRPGRSTILNYIVLGELDMDKYPAPEEVKQEIRRELGKGRYQRG